MKSFKLLKTAVTLTTLLALTAVMAQDKTIELDKLTKKYIDYSQISSKKYFNKSIFGQKKLTDELSSRYSNRSMLVTLDTEKESITKTALMDQVKAHSNKSNTYLALGESHLYSNVAHNFFLETSKLFFENQNGKSKFCTESINTMENGFLGQYIKQEVDRYVTYEDNSPYLTDFKKCYNSRFDNFLIYSGFFHQYRFANAFDFTFPQWPVTTEPGNNIFDQMTKAKQMFIAQIDMAYLELLEVNMLLRDKSITSASILKNRTSQLVNQITKTRDKMVPLYSGANSFRSTHGLITNNSYYPTNDRILKLMPENAYLVITEQDFQLDAPPAIFLDRLANMEDAFLGKLLEKLRKSRFLFSRMMLEPSEDGTLPTFNYGTLPFAMPGDNQLLHLSMSKSDGYYLLADPRKDNMTCFMEKNDKIVVMPCDKML